MGKAIPFEPALKLKQIERFLLELPGVLDASTWLSEGETQAHVTLSDRSELTPKLIQRRCMEGLGLHMTPRRVIVMLSRQLAA
ncbi:MAG: hypothetical protein KF784_05555 [Fimbriimonadaceae bacterium]|nr:hypothetical protein [Fimbriimonadaceae bacterium]